MRGLSSQPLDNDGHGTQFTAILHTNPASFCAVTLNAPRRQNTSLFKLEAVARAARERENKHIYFELVSAGCLVSLGVAFMNSVMLYPSHKRLPLNEKKIARNRLKVSN